MNQAENEAQQSLLRELDERVALIERFLDSLDEQAATAPLQATRCDRGR